MRRPGRPTRVRSLARYIDGAERMFSNAVPIAAGFTRPVVISSRSAKGECAGIIGAYVVLNREGWILTAGHLLDIVRAQQDSARRHAGYPLSVCPCSRHTRRWSSQNCWRSVRRAFERGIACTIADTLRGILDGAPWHGGQPYGITHFTRRLLLKRCPCVCPFIASNPRRGAPSSRRVPRCSRRGRW